MLTHVKKENKSIARPTTTATPDTELECSLTDQDEQLRREEEEECTDDMKLDTEDFDAEEEEEVEELSSTLLSDMTNLQPSVSFRMISPIKSPPKKPKQKTKKRKRSDYLFDSFTPIAVRKHERH